MAAILVCALVIIIVADIVSRNFRLFPMPWSLDVAEYSLYFITFLGAPWVLREEGHIAVDILVARLSLANQLKMARIAHIIAALVCLILFVTSMGVWWRSFANGTMSHETFVFPEWWMLLLAPPVFLILMIMFVRLVIAPPATHDQQSIGF
ncbi:MAG: TRAP transporter small permease [Rhodospirillales bacterium]|nr:TRAP transporter small permease [Rhodospirillales bacterium]